MNTAWKDPAFMKIDRASFVTQGALLIAIALLPAVMSGQNAERKLSLPEAIDIAIRQNRDLQLARLGVAENQAKKAEARSSYYPHIANDSKFTHVTELAGVEIPAGAFSNTTASGPIPTKTLFIGQGSDTSYTSGTGLTQPITQMFKIHNANRTADADLETSKQELTDTQSAIGLEVRQLYFSILIATEQREAAELEVAADQTKEEETKQDISQGNALEVAALESRANLLQAKQTALAQEIKIRDLTLQLNDLLGLPLESRLQLESSSPSFELPLPSRAEALQRVVADSARIKIAEETLIKAKAGKGAAKDNYIPEITGLARYSYQSGIPLLVHNFGIFGFSMTYDLFDGGKRRAEVDEADTKVHEAEVNLEKVKEELTIQLQAAYNKLEESGSLVTVASEVLKARQELARVTREQFEKNAALASSRDEALARMHEAQAGLFEATLGHSLAEAEVLRILNQSPR
jgi:outer membrane protein TolC